MRPIPMPPSEAERWGGWRSKHGLTPTEAADLGCDFWNRKMSEGASPCQGVGHYLCRECFNLHIPVEEPDRWEESDSEYIARTHPPF